jgi:membrane fusion protein, multidrug efflux system
MTKYWQSRSSLLNQIAITIFLMAISSCQPGGQASDLLSNESPSNSAQVPLVRTVVAGKRPFKTKLFTNGKIYSNKEVPIHFRSRGIIRRLLIRNGQVVTAGALLAELENSAQELAVRQAKLKVQATMVELDDYMISQGGKRGDSTSVSPKVYAYLKLRSGYSDALLALEKAKMEFDKTFLYAPFQGIVASLSAQQEMVVGEEQPLCILLGYESMLIKCAILETELREVHVGQQALVEPVGFPGQSCRGTVYDINSIVDEHGLVEMTVRVQGKQEKLISGMNARVTVEHQHPSQIVIPKSAVLERNSRKVVFTYEDGLAKWNYVAVGKESDSEVALMSGISAGQEVIVSGNLNLGDKASVSKK